jgi:hypothetical protein
MPTNFPAPKPTAGVALLVRIARETVGAVILTVAIVLLWLGLGRTAVIFIRTLRPRGVWRPISFEGD